MNRKVKRVEQMVKLLKDPEPRFVSVVDHGANQTPFATLKHINGGHPMNLRKRVTSPGSSVSKGAKASAVRKLVFTKADFADEKAVVKWLKDNEWENYVVTEKGDTFEAATEGLADSDFESLREVAVKTGIVGIVGVPKEAAPTEDTPADGEDEGGAKEEAAKTEEAPAPEHGDISKELSTKFDWWAAYTSRGESTTEVLSDAMSDGCPPGFYDVIQCGVQAMANCLKSDGADLAAKVQAACGEMATIVVALHDVFSGLTDTSSEKMKSAKAIFIGEIEAAIAGPTKKTEETEAAPADKEASSEETSTEEATAANVCKSEPTVDATALAAITDAIGKLTKAVDSVAAKVDDVSKVASDAKEVAEKAAQQATTIAERAPVKKSSATDAVDEPKGEDTEAKQEAISHRLRNLCGL